MEQGKEKGKIVLFSKRILADATNILKGICIAIPYAIGSLTSAKELSKLYGRVYLINILIAILKKNYYVILLYVLQFIPNILDNLQHVDT